MPEFSDFIVYADESGTPNLTAPDADYPVFVLALSIFRKSDYVDFVVPALQRFKFRWFGHDMIVLHERDIRLQKPPFKFLQDPAKREQFQDELAALMDSMPMTVIATAIDKNRLMARYGAPDDPYHLALQFCLERLRYFLGEHDNGNRACHCIFECRGRKEDAALELEFRRIVSGANFDAARLSGFEPLFADKKVNSTGLQVADLVARPIGLSVLRPAQPNRAYAIIETKFRRSASGQIRGYGFKGFP